MKMNRRTRIISVLLCLCVMLGMMSVGMFANAANADTAALNWTEGGFGLSGAENGASKTYKDGAVYLDYSESTDIARSQIQLNAWINGCFTASSMKTTEGATGLTLALDLISADPETPDKTKPTKLDVVVRVTVPVDGVKTQYQVQTNGLAIGSAHNLVLPFSEFTLNGDDSQYLDATLVPQASNIEVVIVTWASYWSAKITNLKAIVSPIYAYTDNAEAVVIPNFGGEEESSTEAPTPTDAPTATPTTTVAPTTPAPTTTVAPTPTTTAAVKAATPAKVKKVTAKSKAKKKVTVTWKAAKNAKKYVVKYSYKKNMKKAKTVTVKKAKATLKKLKSGKKVYIQVQGVNGSAKGKWSAKKAVKVK